MYLKVNQHYIVIKEYDNQFSGFVTKGSVIIITNKITNRKILSGLNFIEDVKEAYEYELVKGNYHHEDMKNIPFNGVYLLVSKKIRNVTNFADEKIEIYNPQIYVATGGYRKSELFEKGKTMEEVLGEKKWQLKKY